MSDDDVIIATGLSKRYPRGVVGVEGLDLRVRRGEVFGLLGPNGAGKTTTLRMLVGLIRPTSGTLTVAGHPAGSPPSLARVGALIESPAFYPHLSGRDNLRLLARYAGIGDDRVEQALAEVDMTDRAARAYRTCSLGMKQRIGVAATLLKDPELLILDEPTNGLDPAGMAAMRDLVKSLRHEQRAVVLSSHLLAEVEHLCDRVAVISAGRKVAEGDLAELRAAASGGGGILARVAPIEGAEALLRARSDVQTVERNGDMLRIGAAAAAAAAINAALVRADFQVSELRAYQRSLEDIFFQLTGDGSEGGPDDGPSEPATASDADDKKEVAAR